MKTSTKTAISVPNSIFEEAERLAKRQGISRSELYAKAVATYLNRHRQENITEALNAIYDEEAAVLDTVFQHIQNASLFKGEW